MDFSTLALNWVIGGAGALILSAAIRALPEPMPMGSRLYLFCYRFANNILANFDLADKAKQLQQPK
ncbi:MAG: hypothetical protein LLG20_18395 [Acidobacteriales bacterium]|nr:hypothetical protein [Terriglobales bacterium]